MANNVHALYHKHVLRNIQNSDKSQSDSRISGNDMTDTLTKKGAKNTLTRLVSVCGTSRLIRSAKQISEQKCVANCQVH
ncbi:hypothetical protein J6590_062087 [Homalodisca vitripennis]|nr:hypothetical protein J6590_062087 [Homalodisca vitripennis]